MIKLIVDNVYTKIIGMNRECELKVWSDLSFEITEFNSPYVKRRHLYNKKTKKTYTGLLEKVINILDDRAEDYEIVDNRVAWEPNADFKLVDYIDKDKKIKLEARPYQQEIVDKASNREVVMAATGAGKTFMMAALIAKFNVKPVSVFADKMTLCTQLRDEFSKFLGRPIGLVGGGVNDKQDITVYSVQSAQPEDIADSKMILFDECLEYNQKVLMDNGELMKIGDIVENKLSNSVISFNHSTNKYESKKITNWSKTLVGEKKIIKIVVGNTSITCTDNHKIYNYDIQKYVRADQLNVGDNLMLLGATPQKIKSIKFLENKIEYVYDITVEDNHNFICNDILVHNCHHIPATTINNLACSCKDAYYRIGVSATPWRDSGDELLIEAVLAPRKMQNNINASKLIELGYLVPCTIYLVPHRKQFKGKNYIKLYNEAIVDNKDRNNDIVKIALNMRRAKKSKTLILIKNVRHGEILLEMLEKNIELKEKMVTVINEKGKECTIRVKNVEFLSGKDDSVRRKAVLQAAKEGFVEILIGSTIADEGLDVPALDTLILAGGGRSSTRAFQRVGRVLRLYPGKERAYVFDFEDATPMLKRHANIRKKLYRTEPQWKIKIFNDKLLR